MHASITGLNQAMCNLAGKMQFFYQKPCQEKYAIILLNSYLLFTGKTILKYLDSLHKIANEGYLIAPKLIPVSYQSPTVDADDQIIRYLMQSIK